MNTYRDIVDRIRTNKIVKMVIIGNSVGCGLIATGWSNSFVYTDGSLGFGGRIRHNKLINFSGTVPVNAWANQFYRFLLSKNGGSILINESGSGWDTNDHRGNAPLASSFNIATENTLAKVLAMSPVPDAVLLPLQINDWGHGLGVATFITNYAYIVDQLIAAGIVPIVVLENPGPNALSYQGGIDPVADYVNTSALKPYVDAATTIATARDLGIIDVFTAFDKIVKVQSGADYAAKLAATGIMFDSVHPNQIGHNLHFEQYRLFFDSPSTRDPNKFKIFNPLGGWTPATIKTPNIDGTWTEAKLRRRDSSGDWS